MRENDAERLEPKKSGKGWSPCKEKGERACRQKNTGGGGEKLQRNRMREEVEVSCSPSKKELKSSAGRAGKAVSGDWLKRPPGGSAQSVRPAGVCGKEVLKGGKI